MVTIEWSSEAVGPEHRTDVLEFAGWGRAICSCGWIHDEAEASDEAAARAEAHAVSASRPAGA